MKRYRVITDNLDWFIKPNTILIYKNNKWYYDDVMEANMVILTIQILLDTCISKHPDWFKLVEENVKDIPIRPIYVNRIVQGEKFDRMYMDDILTYRIKVGYEIVIPVEYLAANIEKHKRVKILNIYNDHIVVEKIGLTTKIPNGFAFEVIRKEENVEKKDWEVHFVYHTENNDTYYKTFFYNKTKEEMSSFLEGNNDVILFRTVITNKSSNLTKELVKESDPDLGKIFNAINKLQELIKSAKNTNLFTQDDMVEYSEYRRRRYKSSFLTSEYDIFDNWLKKRNK